MNHSIFKRFVILAIYLFGQSFTQSFAQTDQGWIFTNDSNTENITTINDFLNNIRQKEIRSAGLENENPIIGQSIGLDLINLDYDSFMQAYVTKVNHSQIKYVDGQLKAFARGSTSNLLLLGFVSLGCFATTFMLPNEGIDANETLGFLAAKLALAGIGIGAGYLAFKELRKKLKKVPLSIFDQQGLYYVNIGLFSGEKIGSENRFKWSDVEKIVISRNVLIYEKDQNIYEKMKLELKNKEDKSLCEYGEVYQPVGPIRFMELVSYLRGKALSVKPDSLPIIVNTSNYFMDKFSNSERKQIEWRNGLVHLR
jgi:hypothetical protein